MKLYIAVGVFIILRGATSINYQIYKMTVIDARCRNIKHPKLWGLLAMNGNNSSGLILYLLTRKKYPREIGTEDLNEIERRKKKALVSLVFLVVGALLTLVLALINYQHMI